MLSSTLLCFLEPSLSSSELLLLSLPLPLSSSELDAELLDLSCSSTECDVLTCSSSSDFVPFSWATSFVWDAPVLLCVEVILLLTFSFSFSLSLELELDDEDPDSLEMKSVQKNYHFLKTCKNAFFVSRHSWTIPKYHEISQKAFMSTFNKYFCSKRNQNHFLKLRLKCRNEK